MSTTEICVARGHLKRTEIDMSNVPAAVHIRPLMESASEHQRRCRHYYFNETPVELHLSRCSRCNLSFWHCPVCDDKLCRACQQAQNPGPEDYSI